MKGKRGTTGKQASREMFKRQHAFSLTFSFNLISSVGCVLYVSVGYRFSTAQPLLFFPVSLLHHILPLLLLPLLHHLLFFSLGLSRGRRRYPSISRMRLLRLLLWRPPTYIHLVGELKRMSPSLLLLA